MLVYQTDDRGVFVGAVAADESPLEPGVHLVPRGAVTEAPPAIPEGQRARWTGAGWQLEDIPPPAGPIVGDPATAWHRVPALALINAASAAGWITEDEADAWAARSALPAAVADVLATLPDAERRPIRRRVLAMTVAERADPLVAAVAHAAGAGDAAVDALFREAAAG